MNTASSNTAFLKIYHRLYEALGPQHWWPGKTPFEIMVGAILTQNTSWRNVSTAIDRIRKANLLDAKKLHANRARIPHLIRPSGFYRTKTEYLQTFLNYYVGHYGGNAKRMKRKRTHTLRKELLAIRGIGQETADAIMLYALKRRTFVVDAYTRRIFSRHKLIRPDQSYDSTKETIEKNIPPSTKLYNEYHALLVRAGKNYCKKNEPLCSACPLGTMLPRGR